MASDPALLVVMSFEKDTSFHAHKFHYEISRLRRLWKTGDPLGTGALARPFA